MSLPTWTPSELRSKIQYFSGEIWRFVEAQNLVATNRLVSNNLDHQQKLEKQLERTKPIISNELSQLNFLLFTPFRYSIPKIGSRFCRAGQSTGVYYGSLAVETALSEICFYRLLFYSFTPELNKPNDYLEYRAFSVNVKSENCIDLNSKYFSEYQDKLFSLENYVYSQEFADIARDSGIEILKSLSVRDPKFGVNISLLSHKIFSPPEITNQQTWGITILNDSIQGYCESTYKKVEFDFSVFSNDSRIANLIQFQKS